jgi:hypothetical protein
VQEVKKKAALNYEGSDETFYDVQKMRTSRWIGATACNQWRTDYEVAGDGVFGNFQVNT